MTVTGSPLSWLDVQSCAETILLIAERLADPAQVTQAAAREGHRQPASHPVLWHPLSLSRGLPGAAALYFELARFDQRWLAVADRHLREAAQALQDGNSRGLYFGPAALLHAAQSSPGHYPKLRRSLATWLAQDQADHVSTLLAREEPGVSCGDYDLISGVSGTLRLLIDSLDDRVEASSAVESAVDASLRYLVSLSEPVQAQGREVPGWWVPPARQPPGQHGIRGPRRDFDLGLAHGVAGPLTVLSFALRRGHEVPGQRDAITRFADWLARWALRDETGIYWPSTVSWKQQAGTGCPPSVPARTAWCYGTPGVAHSLLQAAVAVGAPEWRRLALTSLRDVLNRDDAAWHLSGPTICHGHAGLLQILWRAGTAAGEDTLLNGCGRVAKTVLGFADAGRAFVFPHWLPASPGLPASVELDVAGILEGAAGVACALLCVTPPHLLTAGTTRPADDAGRAWDRCLALS